MFLKNLFQQKKSQKKQKSVSEIPIKKEKELPKDLCSVFREGMELPNVLELRLKTEAEEGVTFFQEYNESRIRFAIDSFEEPMKRALFEILFLLNTDSVRFKEWKYTVYHSKDESKREDLVADIYVEGAPCGVKGIDSLSSIFADDFDQYTLSTFGEKAFPVRDTPPIDGIYSIGSIGTIGHKKVDSDLDLEIQYNLMPFYFDVKKWNDAVLTKALRAEHQFLIKRYLTKKGIKSFNALSIGHREKIKLFFSNILSKSYPLLYQQLMVKNRDFVRDIVVKKNKKLRSKLILEIMKLMKRQTTFSNSEKQKKNEALLKEKIGKVQNYIQRKFPEAEVYLFPFSLYDFRRGHFGSTLDSKESSGGAYELILNYDVLMPGIFFTPSVPTHFLIPPDINNNLEFFNRIIDCQRFDLFEFYAPFRDRTTHQGCTPDISTKYVAKHYGAVYWEAFKATSGNLPKATLNLLRYEMLLEKNIGKTVIQLIKEPFLLDPLIHEMKQSDDLEEDYLTPEQILQLEEEFQQLHRDPWWLRYKALKVAYSIPELIRDFPEMDIGQTSFLIDLSFALHIRLSDVFKEKGDQRKFDSPREQMLLRFLELAFPEGSERYNQMRAIFVGDVKTINEFEFDLRNVFQSCVERIHNKVANTSAKDDPKGSKEFEIWFHYYLKNFKPQPNVVQPSILKHLQMPHGRLQIGFKPDKGWFFRSLKKESGSGKRFQSNLFRFLPNEITLIEKTSFLYGLVYCVINDYYGIFNKGSLNETKTSLEFHKKYSRLEREMDNEHAFLRPNQIDRIMSMVLDFLKPIEVSYLDCIQRKREVRDVLVFLNLLKYGELGFLCRDNLNTITVDLLEIPGFDLNVKEYVQSEDAMFQDRMIYQVLRVFLNERLIDLNQVNFEVWINTNSLQTTQTILKDANREKELAQRFKAQVLKKYNHDQ